MAITKEQRNFIATTIMNSPDVPTDDLKRVFMWLLKPAQIGNLANRFMLVFGTSEHGTLGEQAYSAAHDMSSTGYNTQITEKCEQLGIGFAITGFGSDDKIPGSNDPMGWGVIIAPSRKQIWADKSGTIIIRADMEAIGKTKLPRRLVQAATPVGMPLECNA